MSGFIKIDSQDLTKSLLKLMERSLNFSRPLMHTLVFIIPGGSSSLLARRWFLTLLSLGIVLVAVEKAQGDGRVHDKE